MSCASAAKLIEVGAQLPKIVASDVDTSIDHYQVIVQAAVNPRGKLIAVPIEKSSGCTPLDKAALKATAKLKWRGDKSFHAYRVVWTVQNHV